MSLKAVLKQRVLHFIRSSLSSSTGKKKKKKSPHNAVLVLDSYTSRIVSSCMRMHDLTDLGILAVESVRLQRERLPGMHSIYFVKPTIQSFNAIIHDFRNPKKPQYKSLVLLTTSKPPKQLIAHMAENTHLVARITSMLVTNLDFVAADSRLALFGALGSTSLRTLLFSKDRSKFRAYLRAAARQIASLCFSLHEFPLIRYQTNHISPCVAPLMATLHQSPGLEELGRVTDFEEEEDEKEATEDGSPADGWQASVSNSKIRREDPSISQLLAVEVDRELKEISRQWPNWKFRAEQGLLVLTDRSLDLLSPVMHDTSYEAMARDLMRVEGEMVSVGASKKSDSKESGDSKESDTLEVVLSEEDPIWMKYRHMPFGDVADGLVQERDSFSSSNKMFSFMKEMRRLQQEGKGVADGFSQKEISAALRDNRQYQKISQRLTSHVTLADALVSRWGARKWRTFCIEELELATGLEFTKRGLLPLQSTKDTLNRLRSVLVDPEVNAVDKVRLFLVMAMTQCGLAESDLKLLKRSCLPPIFQRCLQNLSNCGHIVVGGAKDKVVQQAQKRWLTGEVGTGKKRILSFLSRNKKHENRWPRRYHIYQWEQRQPVFKDTPKGKPMRYVPALYSLVDAFAQNGVPNKHFRYTFPPPPTFGLTPDDNELDGPLNDPLSPVPAVEEAPMAHSMRRSWKRRQDLDDDDTGDSKSADTSATTTTTTTSSSGAAPKDAGQLHRLLAGDSTMATENALATGVGRRLIVFMLGGVVTSEVSAMYEVAEKHPHLRLYLASDALLTPGSFVQGLSNVSSSDFKRGFLRYRQNIQAAEHEAGRDRLHHDDSDDHDIEGLEEEEQRARARQEALRQAERKAGGKLHAGDEYDDFSEGASPDGVWLET